MRWLLFLIVTMISAPVLAGGFAQEFGRPLPGLSSPEMSLFEQGRAVFNRDWVPYPGYRGDLDGLGPVFNRASCSGCHFANGRGRPPLKPDEPFISMVLRVNPPHPAYGRQINDRGLLNIPAEGQPRVDYFTLRGQYPDGTPYALLLPDYRVDAPAFGALEATGLSPRVATHIAGVGLLEQVPETAILAAEDPEDRDGDGISGRANWIARCDQRALGRFGWKAEEASIRDQTVNALHQDIGITSADRPRQNCLEGQAACLSAAADPEPEIGEADLVALVFYQQSLAPPRSNSGKGKGQRLFAELACSSCHRPDLGDLGAYTDLLLHDMGYGLADAGEAPGAREWRTAPLWGIGQIARVNGHTRLLHDGRARNVEEAILWHGGEAEAAKRAFMNLPQRLRALLVQFVEGL